MRANLIDTVTVAFVVMFLGAAATAAQVPAPPTPAQAVPPTPPEQAAPQATPAELDQMLAPIALYPDALLAQILMAATYPLEVVEAARWLEDPNNAALKGDQLAAALAQQTWDPSVKSLVPFPQVLRMMDGRLDWTERLGDAFLANQDAVMDSVQRLRQRAQAAGKLRSTPQEVVTTQGPEIMIEPPSPETVYVPVYDPLVVYGGWPYPGFPPYYFPDFFAGVVIGAFGFGWYEEPIIGPLWGWHHWDWGGHRIDIDRGRWTALNRNRPPPGGGAWEHDPSHRRSVPYQSSATRSRFPGAGGSLDARRSLRGYPTSGQAVGGQARVSRPQAGGQAIGGQAHGSRPRAGGQAISGQAHGSRPQAGGQAVGGQARVSRPQATVPSFESYGRGAEVRAQADRGHSSRMSMPSSSSRGGGRPVSGARSVPSGGGGHRAPPGSGGRGSPSGGGGRGAPSGGDRGGHR